MTKLIEERELSDLSDLAKQSDTRCVDVYDSALRGSAPVLNSKVTCRN